MSEAAVPYGYPTDVPRQGEALPRCCPSHEDWSELSRHLIDDFPDVPIGDLVREVRRAQDAVDRVDLPLAEAVEIGELIVRHQLMMRVGHVRDAARLDPEKHVRAVT